MRQTGGEDGPHDTQFCGHLADDHVICRLTWQPERRADPKIIFPLSVRYSVTAEPAILVTCRRFHCALLKAATHTGELVATSSQSGFPTSFQLVRLA